MFRDSETESTAKTTEKTQNLGIESEVSSGGELCVSVSLRLFRDQAVAGAGAAAAAARRAFLIIACMVSVGKAPLLSQ